MNLLLFNLKTDADDDVLGFTTDWINALARHFDEVFVITMAAGRVAVAPNVIVYSVGKEKDYSEARRAFEFYRILVSLLRRKRIDACFAHMMPLFSVMAWPLLAPRKIPTVLWFAHKATPFTLKAAHRLVDRVVTSVPAGFGLKSDKVVVVGQGITEEKFSHPRRGRNGGPFTIISVGRISAIKHLRELVDAVAEIARARGREAIRLVLLGDALTDKDKAYKEDLLRRIKETSLQDVVKFPGSVRHAKVANWLANSDLSINLSCTGAIDKAVIESLAMKTPVLVRNEAFAELFREGGVEQAPFLTGQEIPRLRSSIEAWMDVRKPCGDDDLDVLSKLVLSKHGLRGLASRISDVIKSLVEQQGKSGYEFQLHLR